MSILTERDDAGEASSPEMSARLSRVWVLLAAALLGIWPADAYADSLSGRILDPSGGAVARVSLRLFDRSTGQLRQATSAQDGGYRFQNIPPGDYLLEGAVSRSSLGGSEEVSVRGDRILDLELAISAANVEVMVTASSLPQSIEETAKAVDVVTAGEIAMRNEFSVAEAVRHIAGVRVQTLEGPGSLTTIQTRGLRIHDTAVLIDGMRFRDAASPQGDATAFLGAMTTLGAERIEFLRGSGSSLYGSNAMAGVLDITSRQGGGRPHAEIRFEGGGLGLLRGVVGVAGGLRADRFAYSGNVSHINVTKGVRDGNPYRNNAAQGSASYSLLPGMSLTGRLLYTGDYLASTESPAFPAEVLANFPATGPVRAVALPTDQLELYERRLPFDAGRATFVPSQMDPDGRQSARVITGNVTFRHQITPFTSYRVAYQGVDTRRAFIDGPASGGDFEPAVGTRSRFEGRIDTVQVRLDTYAGDRNLVVLGYEFEREEYLDFAASDGADPPLGQVSIEQDSHAVFLQDQVRLFDNRLQVTMGGRAQFYALGTPSFSGTGNPYQGAALDRPPAAYTADVSVAYFSPGTQTKLRAHAGNSYRSPSPYERFGGTFSSFTGTFDYWGDPRLRPERSVAVDGGVDQWVLGSRVRLSGTVFYTNLQETVVFDFVNFPAAGDPFGRFGGYRNSGGGIARGVELGTQLSPAQGSNLQVAYTYTNSDSRTPTIGTDFFQVQGISDHVFAFTATQWIARRFNVTFDFSAAGDYILSPFGAGGRQLVFDGPVRGDVVARYLLGFGADRSAEIYVKVENVFDRRPYEDGFLGPGVGAVAGFRVEY